MYLVTIVNSLNLRLQLNLGWPVKLITDTIVAFWPVSFVHVVAVSGAAIVAEVGAGILANKSIDCRRLLEAADSNHCNQKNQHEDSWIHLVGSISELVKLIGNYFTGTFQLLSFIMLQTCFEASLIYSSRADKSKHLERHLKFRHRLYKYQPSSSCLEAPEDR